MLSIIHLQSRLSPCWKKLMYLNCLAVFPRGFLQLDQILWKIKKTLLFTCFGWKSRFFFCSLIHSFVRLCAYNVLESSLFKDILFVRFVWNEMREWKHQLDICRWKSNPALLLFFFSLAATEDTCSGLWYSGWNIPGSSMLVLVTLSLHRNLSFSSICSSTLAMDGNGSFYIVSDTFYIKQIDVYKTHKSCSYRGKGNNKIKAHIYLFAFLATEVSRNF